MLDTCARVPLHRLNEVPRLERDGLECSTHDVGASSVPRDTDEQTTGVLVPVGCAQSDEGRDEVELRVLYALRHGGGLLGMVDDVHTIT